MRTLMSMYQIYQDVVQFVTSQYSYNRRLVVRRLYLHWLGMLVMCALAIALLVDSHFLCCAERNFQSSVLYQSCLLRKALQDTMGARSSQMAMLSDQMILSELLQSYALMPGLDFFEVLSRNGKAYGLSAVRGIVSPRGGYFSQLQSQAIWHRQQMRRHQPHWMTNTFDAVVVGLPFLENRRAQNARWFIFVWSRASTQVWHDALPVICGVGLLMVLLLFLPGLMLSLPLSSSVAQLQRNRLDGFAALESAWRRMRSAQTKLLHLEVL